MTVIQRIIKLYKSENLEQKEFSEKIGIPSSTFNNMLKRDSDPKYSTLRAILDAYPKLRFEWLMFGTGEMWIESPKSNQKSTDTEGGILEHLQRQVSDLSRRLSELEKKNTEN